MWTNKPSALVPGTAAPVMYGSVVGFPGSVPDETSGGVAGGLRIVGEIKGREDLFIAGDVCGSVFLPDCRIHVGPDADVSANMTARVVEIEGRVTGNLTASERVAIRSSGTVTGDVVSPQIEIDEGCKFKGSVEMREPDVEQGAPAGSRLVAGAGTARIEAANEQLIP
ncbi:MAG: polymer-forming cytoskeletal protein [Gammaproteobacteria bacterium]|nr:polymer-forming cytoskeletal protein [Gammaproteobacteria bacterium]